MFQVALGLKSALGLGKNSIQTSPTTSQKTSMHDVERPVKNAANLLGQIAQQENEVQRGQKAIETLQQSITQGTTQSDQLAGRIQTLQNQQALLDDFEAVAAAARAARQAK